MARSRTQTLTQDLNQGTYTRGGERLSGWSYYDTFLMASTVATQRMFTVPQSAAKPLDLTNMTIGGQIPAGQKLKIFNIKLFIATAAAVGTAVVQNLYDMLSRTTIEVIIENKASMLTLTLQEILGVSTLTAVTPSVAGDNIPVISPRFHGIYPLNMPIILQQLTPFEVRVTHQAAAAFPQALDNTRVKISLNGELIRRT